MLIKLITVLFFVIVKCVSGICDWPDSLANTIWHDSSKGEITFSTDTLTGWNIKVTGALSEPEYDTWTCHSTALYQSDNILVAITTNSFELFDKPFYAYLCFQLTEITQSSYRYYLMFRINTDMNNERVGALDDADSENWGLLCHQDDNYASYRPSDSEYRVMIKSDNVAAAKIDCPYTILGSYDYTHTLDGTTSCASTVDVLSTCTNSQEISFDYNTCNTKVAYSESNQVWCVDTVPFGGDNYVTLYNGNAADADIDNVNIFRFSCIVISGDGSKASIVPNSCRKDQSPVTVPTQVGQSDGATLTLTKYTESCLTCPLLTAPDSGTVTYSTNGAVTSASFNCSPEYSLVGPDNRVCQADDTWSDVTPTCTCSLPAAPANGSLLASVDGTLTYFCDVGFVLNGDRTRTCQPNSNTWSGLEPSCVSSAPSTENKSTSDSLLPAVIVLAVIGVAIGIALGLALIYIWKLKKIPQGNTDEKKSNENGINSYMFSSLPPRGHSQHIMDTRNTSSAMSAPRGNISSPRVDSVTPRSLSSSTSNTSLHLSHLNLIREKTRSDILDQTTPAPWSKKGKQKDKNGSISNSKSSMFPPLSENGTLVTPRGNIITEHHHAKKKKLSFGEKIQRQNSTEADKAHAHMDTKTDKKPKNGQAILNKVNSLNTAKVANLSSTTKTEEDISNGRTSVPKLKLPEQPQRASTPVKHYVEIREPDSCSTPRSNTFTTVQ